MAREVPKGTKSPGAEPAARERPLPDFFYRLTPRLQRCYLKSDSIDRFDFVITPGARKRAADLVDLLDSGNLRATERGANELADEICRLAGVAPVPVLVRGVRPHNARGELHGLFRVDRPQGIVLWMRTAQRHDVVKPRTFLRTLLHELCHYFDYALLELEDSFHTMGFFRRESFLVRAVAPLASRGG
jgi:hypothetical protein